METIKARSFPRAGFLGNPSDGYFGKTLSFAFADYCVDLSLTESAKMRFIPGEVDDAMFDSPESLVRDLRLYGYYGGIRMLKAVAKLFFEYCFEHDIKLPRRNFTAEYRTNIPRLVGLSGSSAICSAMLKALCKFYEVPIISEVEKVGGGGQRSGNSAACGIPMDYTPTICLEAEKLELGINCGFQDRVIHMYGGLVFMDFRKDYVEANNKGLYEELDPKLLKNVYVAFDPNRAEESGKAHNKVKRLFEEKKPDILSAMSEFASIAQRGRDILVSCKEGDNLHIKLADLVNANFDLRDKIFNVAEENRRMVMTARSVGASAKFAGSGGAIVGTFEDEAQFAALSKALAKIGCTTFIPTIGTRELESADMLKGKRTAWRNS